MKRSSAKPGLWEPLPLVSAAAVSPFPCGHEEKPTPSLCGQFGQHAGRSLALVLIRPLVMTQAGLKSRRQGRWPSVVTTGDRTAQTIRGHWTLMPDWRDCALLVGHISGQTGLTLISYLSLLSCSYSHSCHFSFNILDVFEYTLMCHSYAIAIHIIHMFPIYTHTHISNVLFSNFVSNIPSLVGPQILV